MITKQQAVDARHGDIFHHVSETNADGTPLRVRVTGKCKTWKRDTNRFRLPVKYGLKQSLAIDQDNANQWVKP